MKIQQTQRFVKLAAAPAPHQDNQAGNAEAYARI